MEIIALIATTVVGTFAYLRHDSEKKKKQRLQLEQARIQLEAANNERVKATAIMLGDFKKYLTEILVIDSNIWMNEDYKDFFFALKFACVYNKYKIEIFGVQFDEISNIKKSTAYGDPKNKWARLAIQRIEDFQKNDLLRVLPITIDAERGAYADPVIVKFLAEKAREGKECTFISDDKELRIRVRQHFCDVPTVNWNIIEVETIQNTCSEISKGLWHMKKMRQSEQASAGNP